MTVHITIALEGFEIFSTFDSNVGRRIYSTDGTTAGTRLLTTIPNSGTISVGGLGSAGTHGIYYVYTSASGVYSIYGTDGATAQLLAATNHGLTQSVTDLTNAGSFDIFSTFDSSVGRQIYATDGTAAGTHVLSSIPASGTISVGGLGGAGSHGIYYVYTSASGVYSIYSTDGATTQLIAATNHGLTQSVTDLTSAGSFDIFSTFDSSVGRRIYTTDGTVAGTHVLSTIPASGTISVGGLGSAGSHGLYYVYTSASGVYSVYGTDGSTGGTQLLAATNHGLTQSVTALTSAGGFDIFSTFDSSVGRRIYSSDGTAAGTHLLSTIPNSGTISVGGLGSAGSHGLYYVYTSASGVYSIYGTDGSSTQLLAATDHGLTQSVTNLTSAGGFDIFSTFDSSDGRRIYSTDGTAQGTHLLTTIPNSGTISVGGLGSDGSHGLYYVYTSASGIYSIYGTDGTAAGTQLIATTNNASSQSVIGLASVLHPSTAAPQSLNLAENQSLAADIDASVGAGATFSLAGGADVALFAIDPATGLLTFRNAPDYEAPADVNHDNVYDVVVRASNGTVSNTQTVAVHVTNLNEAPSITSNGRGDSAALNVVENGKAVTTVTAADPDAGTTLAYHLTGGADAALFQINAATGALAFIAAPDFETPKDANGDNIYEVMVSASDGALADSQALAVHVTDLFEYQYGTDSDDTLNGGAGADGLLGNGGADVIRSYGGDDIDYGGDGDDHIYAGDGDDTAGGDAGNDYLDGGAGNDKLYGWVGNDTILGQGGNDFILGDAGDDALDGGAGVDALWGFDGDDRLDGGPGADELHGEKGNDSYYVDTQGDLAFENAGEGTDSVVASADYYLYANIENLTIGAGAGDRFGVGNDLANTITGNEGANLLLGGAGADMISGGAGNDRLYGEAGADQISGGAGVDYLIGGAADDVLDGGGDSDGLYGEAGNDTLSGGTDFQTDILVGGDGNDILRGNSGLGDYDLMDGGAGNDNYYVDTGADLTFESAGGGTDTVYADVAGNGVYLYAEVENLVLLGTTFFGVGNDLANRLTGNAVANWLLGGAGNDVLDGKGGNDVLFGEAGADIFVFERGTGGDVISDFAPGTDRIDLTAFGFATYQTVVNSMHEVNGTTAIDLGGGDFIVLTGVSSATLHTGDFILSGGSQAPQPVDIATEGNEDGAEGPEAAGVGRFGLLHLLERPQTAFHTDGNVMAQIFL